MEIIRPQLKSLSAKCAGEVSSLFQRAVIFLSELLAPVVGGAGRRGGFVVHSEFVLMRSGDRPAGDLQDTQAGAVLRNRDFSC